MNNIGTLYRFEIKKILCRRITVIAMIAVTLLMIAMNAGEYLAGSKVVNKQEQILTGRALDDAMLDEMRAAIEPVTITTEDGTQTAIGVGVKDPTYEPLMEYLTTIGGNIDKAYHMSEKELNTRFNGVIDEIQRQQYLTEKEIHYWEARHESSPMPLQYGKIQNGWGDAVTIMYVVSIFCLIITAVTLSGVFSDEPLLRTDALIFSSRNGKRRLVTAKLLAGCTVGFLETLVILLTSVGTEFAISGFDGGDTSVQFFVGPTAMDMSIQKVFWIYVGIMLIIGLLLSLTAMCLSQVCNNSIAVVAVMMVLWLVSVLNPPYSWRLLSQACSYLPVTFLGNWTFSDYRMIDLFGHLFSIFQIAPVLYIVLSLVLGWLTKLSYLRYEVSHS